jgi:hypothetical protein
MTLIYDPAAPSLIFDGLLQVFSTCATCGQIMQVINPRDTTHPCCEPPPMTYAESLAQGWLSAVKAGDTEAADLTQTEIDKLDAQPPDLAAAAIQYATWGWGVFPLAEHSHKPFIRSAHPEGDPLHGKCKGTCGRAGHGFHDATTDPERITKWWTKHPTHNIGLATGALFDVIDVDPKNNGIPAFMELLQSGRLPDAHGVAVTRSGGTHLYVTSRHGRSRPGIRQGIDYKACGGYVCAPPTVMRDGRTYSWLTVPSPAIVKGGNR